MTAQYRGDWFTLGSCRLGFDNEIEGLALADHAHGRAGPRLDGLHAGVEVRHFGIKRGMLLPVSAPFHCPLMQPAADAMAEALAKTPPSALRVPLFANVTAAMVGDAAEVEDVGTFVEESEGVVERGFRVEVLAAVGEGIGRDVDDAHEQSARAKREGASAEAPVEPGTWSEGHRSRV